MNRQGSEEVNLMILPDLVMVTYDETDAVEATLGLLLLCPLTMLLFRLRFHASLQILP